MRNLIVSCLFCGLALSLPTDENRQVKAVTDAELQDLTKQLHLSDVNAVKGIVLNLQGQTNSGNTADKAPSPLFQYVPPDALTGPTMSKLVAMFDNYIADCTQTEVVSPQETSEDDAFLDAILATSVMQQAHQFLVTKGLADSSVSVFKEYLRQIWLGFYNRGGGIQGSSGYEHVFLGEKNGNSISGYHGWVKYYQDEKAGRVNYLGFITSTDIGESTLLEVPMSWDGIYKSLNSLTVSNSPELELAIATVCFLARPNAVCPVMGGNGTPYGYQTYTQAYNGKTYVGSAYPVAP